MGETVTIPSELNGYPVDTIYNKEESGSIFAKAEDESVIKNVVISNGIKNIGDYENERKQHDKKSGKT